MRVSRGRWREQLLSLVLTIQLFVLARSRGAMTIMTLSLALTIAASVCIMSGRSWSPTQGGAAPARFVVDRLDRRLRPSDASPHSRGDRHVSGHRHDLREPISCWAPRARRLYPVGSKTETADAASRRLLMIVAQKPAQSLAVPHRPHSVAVRIPRKQQDVTLPLVISLGMEMVDVFAQRPP